MTWQQLIAGGALIGGCVALFIWGPTSAAHAAAGLGGAAAVVLGGGISGRGPAGGTPVKKP